MKTVIVADTKWGTQIYETAGGLLRERVEQGFWYHGEDVVRAKAIVAELFSGDPDVSQERAEGKAWEFLRERRDHEYEGVEAQEIGA